MRIALNLLIVWIVCSATLAASGITDVIGTWEGESKCMVPNSPCHDEHARYKISADKKDPTRLSVEGYKVVNNEAQFMGTLTCEYRAAQSTLSCSANTAKQDDWEFQGSGGTMTGTLTIGPEKTLFRRMSLHKVSAK